MWNTLSRPSITVQLGRIICGHYNLRVRESSDWNFASEGSEGFFDLCGRFGDSGRGRERGLGWEIAIVLGERVAGVRLGRREREERAV